MEKPDFLVIGGGVIGFSIAHALAGRGAGSVALVERGRFGAEASGAAAGLLAVASSRAPGGVLFALRRESARMFADWAAALHAESGIDPEYRCRGLIEIAFQPREAEELARLAEKRNAEGFEVELLDAPALRALEPGVSAEAIAAARFHDDRSVHNGRLMEALRVAAERRGVRVRCAAPATAAEVAGGRVLSVDGGGERYAPGCVILAAGAWSSQVGSLFQVKIPVRPDRGEMVALRPQAPLLHALAWNDGYLVPRNDGEVVVGSTSTRGVYEKEVTARSLATLLGRAIRMVPGLAGAALDRMWAGLRPCPAIRRPILGRARDYTNLLIATGHHRSGILLAPVTGELIADLATGVEPRIDLQPFCYRPR